MRRIALLLGVLLLASTAHVARTQGTSLGEELDALLQGFNRHATVGVLVRSLDRRATLYEREADRSFNPASNEKLFTTAAALALLGPDHTYRTRLMGLGVRRGDVLDGSLVLLGGGDPVLEPDDVADLASAVRDSGIRTVTGRLRVDDYRYDDRRLGSGWSWDNETFYYSAQISALTVGRNVAVLELFPGPSAGQPIRIIQSPTSDYLQVNDDVLTGAAADAASVSSTRERASNVVRLSGVIPLGGERVRRVIAVEDPALHAAAILRERLTAREVTVQGETERRPTPGAAWTVGEHTSPPLREIVALLNKPSDNLVAEMVLKELGYARGGRGSAAAGSSAVVAWLREIGVETGGIRFNDGSGLSRLDLLTPRAVCQLLEYASGQSWGELWRESLPIAGVDGTLRNRMRDTPAARNVHAKTGTLSHVSALSGYVTSASGERLIFSVMTNNLPDATTPAKRLEDRIAIALASHRGE